MKKRGFKYLISFCVLGFSGLIIGSLIKDFVLEIDNWSARNSNFPKIAKAVQVNGSAGDDIEWNFDSDTGILDINGTGKINTYKNGEAPWYEYREYITKVIISDSITSISDGMLYGLENLEELTIPFVGTQREIGSSSGSTKSSNNFNFGFIFGKNSYTGSYSVSQNSKNYSGTKIGSYYYYDADSRIISSSTTTTSTVYYIPNLLKKVTVTDASILYWGAFQNCSKIEHFILNDEIKKIDDYAFMGCKNLHYFNLSLDSSVDYIGSFAFSECDSIEDFIIPNSVKTINSNTFNSCSSLHMIELPEGLTTIKLRSFYNCKLLQEINLPSTIQIIEDYAFYNCSSILEIYLPENLISIGDYAFSNLNKVKILVIPDSVQTIGEGALQGWSSLEELSIPFVGMKREIAKTKSNYAVSTKGFNFGYIFGGTTYSGSYSVSQSYANANGNYYGVLLSDGYYHYDAECANFTNKTTISTTKYWLPNSLNTVFITDTTVLYVGAFENCSQINKLYLTDKIQKIDYLAFNGLGMIDSSTDDFVISGNILMRYKGNEETVVIPEGIRVIGPSAFVFPYKSFGSTIIADSKENKNINTVQVPQSVSFISNYSFYKLTSATIIIPKKVGNLTISDTSFTSTKMVSYLDVNTATNGNDTFYFSVNGSTASIVGCTTTSLAITLPTELGGYIVTSVGFKGMANCTTLTSVTIPSTIFELGEYSFYGCTGITTITIPSTVLIIGDYAFGNCTSLHTVTLAEGIEHIGDFSFYNCTELFEIVVPDSITYLGSYCFYNCTSLTSATIGILVEDINSHAFYNCTSLSSVTIGTSVKTIGDFAFYNCALSRITTPSSLISIGEYSFAYNRTLNRITLRNNLEIIGEGAFYYCVNLANISLPEKITQINNYAFAYCTSLSTFNHTSSFTRIGAFSFLNTSLNEFAFDETLMFIGEAAFKNTLLTSVYLPDSIDYIGGDAFANCKYLKNLSIPDRVSYVGTYAFENNNKLDVIIRYVSGIVTDKMFYGSTIYSVTIEEGITIIGNGVFQNCYNLLSVSLPTSLLKIDDYAFSRCISLKSIYIKENCYEIGNYAFVNCYFLIDFIMPDTVCSIGNDAFINNFYNTITVYSVNGYIADYLFEDQSIYHLYLGNQIYELGEKSFSSISNLIDISLSDEVENIGVLCFFGDENLQIYVRFADGIIDDGVFKDCNTVSRFFIESGIHTISEHSFDSCKALERMDLPNTIQSIGSYAFYDCNSMTYINIPIGIQIINSYVFFGCASLESIDLPNTYKSIQDYAFYGCIMLKQIYISDICDGIGSYAFYNCKSLESINIKNSIKNIGDYAFRSCVLLSVIEIGDNVTNLGICVFYDCNGLEKVYLGKGIYELKDRLFYGCVNLSDLYLYAPQAYIDELTFYGAEDVTVHIGHDNYMENYFTENGINYVIDESIIYEYKIVFLDENGDVIYENTYNYGDTVDIPNDPTKASDNTYTYIFAGWDKTVTNVNGNCTYTATYTKKYIDYTVTFYNEDGSLISSQTYHYGDKIVAPEDPTKASDNVYEYTFSGWDEELGTCTGDMTFTATYSKKYIEYAIIFVNDDGSVISSKTYHYGDKVEVPADPTKNADNTYTYTFAGWDKTITAVTGDATYTATYTATYIEYIVSFYNEDGSLISSQTYHYGDKIVAPEDPTKASDNTYDYIFAGWDNTVDTCLGNMSFKATYTKQYSKEYLSGQLRDQLLDKINDETNVDLSSYKFISEIESRLSELTDEDKAIVEVELNKLIEKYNDFVNMINSEFNESVLMSNNWLFGIISSSINLFNAAALLYIRRFL